MSAVQATVLDGLMKDHRHLLLVAVAAGLVLAVVLVGRRPTF